MLRMIIDMAKCVLSTNNLLNSFQSAYIKHHSTETTLHSDVKRSSAIKMTRQKIQRKIQPEIQCLYTHRDIQI